MINLNNPLSSIVRDSMTAAGSCKPENPAGSETGREKDSSSGIQPILTSTAADTVQKSSHDDIADIRSEIDILTKQLNDNKKAPEAEPVQKKDIRKSASLTIKSVISAAAGFVTGYAAARIQENMEKGSRENIARENAALQKSTADNPPDLREKEKSLSLLISAEEGDSGDASEDLDMILKSLRPGESIREASEGFARLMKSEDYSTCDAQAAYGIIDASLKPGEKRSAAVDSYVRILKGTDDCTYETRDNYTFIDSYINSRNSRKTVTDQFLRILKQTDGNSSNTRDIFTQFHAIQ